MKNFQIDQSAPVALEAPDATRNAWQAIKRGVGMRCPACGEGKLYGKYLKVNDVCPSCGQELHHHRADDAPPYVTMFITGHVIVAGIMYVERYYALDLWMHGLIWLPLLLVMSLVLLPPVKGAFVGIQWANRMHGFGDDAMDDPARPDPEPSPRERSVSQA